MNADNRYCLRLSAVYENSCQVAHIAHFSRLGGSDRYPLRPKRHPSIVEISQLRVNSAAGGFSASLQRLCGDNCHSLAPTPLESRWSLER